MKVFVKAKPGSKIEGIRPIDGLFKDKDKPQFIVSVKERPTAGNANRAIEKAIASHFGVAPSRVRVVSGHTSREKVLEIRPV